MKTDLTIYAILGRSRSGMSDFKDEKNFYRSIDMHLLNLETFTDKNKIYLTSTCYVNLGNFSIPVKKERVAGFLDYMALLIHLDISTHFLF